MQISIKWRQYSVWRSFLSLSRDWTQARFPAAIWWRKSSIGSQTEMLVLYDWQWLINAFIVDLWNLVNTSILVKLNEKSSLFVWALYWFYILLSFRFLEFYLSSTTFSSSSFSFNSYRALISLCPSLSFCSLPNRKGWFHS